MRIARFLEDGRPRYGVVRGELIHELRNDPFENPGVSPSASFSGLTYPLSGMRLLAPCLPSKIVAVGVNYRPHAQEMNSSLPSQPLIFLKPPTALIGPEDPIVLPRNWKRVDYEGELAVVIGRKAKNVGPDQSRDYVFGYTCCNDVTERQFQKDDVQWTRGKGCDTFCPLGPWIETEINPDNLGLETLLNGRPRQSARTAELVFGVAELISFISDYMTLLPGDIIATGTPAGVGPLQPGDIVEVRIENIGTLRNRVAAT